MRGALRGVLMHLGAALALALFVFSPVRAQTPRLTIQVDTTHVTVGDPIRLLVSVSHGSDQMVAWPDSLDLSPFEILDAQASGPTGGGETVTSSLALRLAAYDLGDLEIPGFPVTVVGPQSDTTVLDTNPFGIRVESVGLDEGGDIRGLKGPLGIPLNAGRIALWGLAAFLVGLLGWVLYRRLRRRGAAPAEVMPGIPSRPPHEVALEALARLEASPLLERGEVKEFHIQVSEILRTYLEDQLRVPALELTTRDILVGLERAGQEIFIREDFRTFLDRCDMVKFAKHRPDAGFSRDLLVLGRDLVEKTMPRPSVTEGPEVAEGPDLPGGADTTPEDTW